jgi:exopolysaccharide production protein ExoQ
MFHLIAIAATIACIAGLFVVEADPDERTSWALWLPLFWCLINGSKPISEWIHGQSAKTLQRYSEGTPMDAAIYGLMILLALLVLNYRSGQVRRFIQFNPALMMFLLYCAASILWSDFPLVAFKRWIKEAGDVVMVLVVLTDPHPLASLKRIFARTALVFVPISLLFILFIPSMGTEYDPTTGVTYYNGMMTQKNQLGQSCLVAGLGCLWLLLNAIEAPRTLRRRKLLMLYGATFAGAVWLIVKANSMTSLSCMAEASVVMILITRPWVRQRASRVLAVACGAVGFAAFAVFLDSAGGLLHSIGRSSSLTGRTDIWRAVLAVHTNPLIGTGYESFWLGKRLEFVWDVTGQHGILQSHNGYIEIFVNLGWVGIFMLAWVVVAGFRSALIAFYRDPRAGRLGIAFLTAALIYNVSEAGFRMMTLIWFAFLLAVTGIPSGEQPRPVEKAVQRRIFNFAPKRTTRILQ